MPLISPRPLAAIRAASGYWFSSFLGLRGRRGLWLSGLGLVGLCSVGAPAAVAQGVDMAGMGAVEDFMLKHGEAAIQRAADTLHPRVTPAAVVFTPTTSHVTIQLTNPLDSAVTLDLAVRQTLPQPDTAGLLVRDSLAPTALRAQDLTSWVQGVPAQLTLAAHASQSLEVSVTPPAGVTDGEYWTTLTIVAPRVTVHTTLSYHGQPVPVTGPIPFTLTTRVPLVYRQGAVSASLTAGAPTATVVGDSVVRVCVPLHHTGVAGVPLLLTALVPHPPHVMRTRVPLVVQTDVTPCVPVAVVTLVPGRQTAELQVAVDSQTPVLLPTLAPTFASVHARVAFTIPAAARAAGRLARARDTVTNLRDSVFTTVLLEPQPGSLVTALAREVRKAVQQGRTPVLDVGATWCGPCHELDRVWRQPGMRATVRGMYIIRIDGDLWGDQLSELGLGGSGYPVLLRLGRDGHAVGAPQYGVKGLTIAPGAAQPGERLYDVVARQVATELAPFFEQARTDFAKHD